MENLTFEQWLKAADKECERRFMMGLDDFAGAPSRDAYEDELTPVEFVSEILPEWDDIVAAMIEAGA